MDLKKIKYLKTFPFKEKNNNNNSKGFFFDMKLSNEKWKKVLNFCKNFENITIRSYCTNQSTVINILWWTIVEYTNIKGWKNDVFRQRIWPPIAVTVIGKKIYIYNFFCEQSIYQILKFKETFFFILSANLYH